MYLRSYSLSLCIISLNSVFYTGHSSADPHATKEPLYSKDDLHITYLTDQNWDSYMNNLTRPWLVEFYHPFCPHCLHFVPTFKKVAEHYNKVNLINVGAISCMDHVKCRTMKITGFPTLVAINFNQSHPGENQRVVGTHTKQQVIDYVNAAFKNFSSKPTSVEMVPPTEQKKTESTKLAAEETEPGEQKRTEIWEESTNAMNQTTRIQDAASAFLFGLKQGVFMGREYLDDMELDALKEWLRVVRLTFPGSINRKIIDVLYSNVRDIATLEYDNWQKIVDEWQKNSTILFKAEMNQFQVDDMFKVPEWQRLDDLFQGFGVTYRACALYTCGQWNMFHMLTMNPMDQNRDDDLLLSVVTAIRRFVKHFFSCVQCRDHFLQYNDLKRVMEIAHTTNKTHAVKFWLWEMHNAVNDRVMHPIWPKKQDCVSCGQKDHWNDVEIDQWLSSVYGYKEMPLALKIPRESVSKEAKVSGSNEKKINTLQKQVPDSWKPKDAAKGILNPANTYVDKEGNAEYGVTSMMSRPAFKHSGSDSMVTEVPSMAFFAWYMFPFAAVVVFIYFKRSQTFKGRYQSLSNSRKMTECEVS